MCFSFSLDAEYCSRLHNARAFVQPWYFVVYPSVHACNHISVTNILICSSVCIVTFMLCEPRVHRCGHRNT